MLKSATYEKNKVSGLQLGVNPKIGVGFYPPKSSIKK